MRNSFAGGRCYSFASTTKRLGAQFPARERLDGASAAGGQLGAEFGPIDFPLPNTAPNFGIQTNPFGFIISWATNIPVVVEASQTLVTPAWVPISTNTLSGGSSYFSDPQWTNYPARFYRIRSQ